MDIGNQETQRLRVRVSGIVQGVGFRPFVWKTATAQGCTGWVRNGSSGVELELQGKRCAVEQCLLAIQQQAPPLSQVQAIDQADIPCIPGELSFAILESDTACPAFALVSADIATCLACQRELEDRDDRRFGYPFINCTDCGPRFTIQQAVPYDRAQTTMRRFQMCTLCQSEYDSPSSRRFHAQPNACPQCGPTIWYVPSQHAAHALAKQQPQRTSNDFPTEVRDIIYQVRTDIALGKIVAMKGIGGFHLACDARQSEAVLRLRARKHRRFKPLAVMVRDLTTATQLVELSDKDRQALTDSSRPIVLLRKRTGLTLPAEIAPNNPYLGVMLPYAPLHHLLLEPGDVWVMTSGNRSEEPIVIDNDEAIERLGDLAEAFLLHNRPIHVSCDDSVFRASPGGNIPIRRSRGFAPLPITLRQTGPCVLAVGGEFKTSVCLATRSHAIMGQHLGDMGDVQTIEYADRSCDHLQALYQVQPEAIVADAHPGYISTWWAQRRARDSHIPCIQVQHHHAHAASLLAEHGLPNDQPIIACVLDGTGYGTDHTIWGGEILLASGVSFHRLAHLQTMPLPGGDACILHPARTAVAWLYGCGLPWSDHLACVAALNPHQLKLLRQQLDKRINVMPTSSMGRLFDAVASLIGICHAVDYEGQAAMELEYLAERSPIDNPMPEAYSFHWSPDSPSQLQLAPILAGICADLERSIDRAKIALRFHRTIALAFTQQCVRIRQALQSSGSTFDTHSVGLTGGVFQNALLFYWMQTELEHAGFTVLTHHQVPPNDGGLALGQVFIARSRLATAQTQNLLTNIGKLA